MCSEGAGLGSEPQVVEGTGVAVKTPVGHLVHDVRSCGHTEYGVEAGQTGKTEKVRSGVVATAAEDSAFCVRRCLLALSVSSCGVDRCAHHTVRKQANS